MDNELKNLIIKNAYRTLQIEMATKTLEGLIVTREIVNEIIRDLENNLIN